MFDKAELHMLVMALRLSLGNARTVENDLRREIAWNESDFGNGTKDEETRDYLAYAVETTASWQSLHNKAMAAYNEGN